MDSAALLELHGVVAGYGPVTVLNGLSLAVAPQARLAMIGRNGVGKTTTLRAVMGLARLTAGTSSSTVKTSPAWHRTSGRSAAWATCRRRATSSLR